MSSPSQRRGSCGHMMVGFDLHGVYARCRDKKKGKDPCVEKPEADCHICLSPQNNYHNFLHLRIRIRRRSVS